VGDACAFCARSGAVGLLAGVTLSVAALATAACARETQPPVVIEPAPPTTATTDVPDVADAATDPDDGAVVALDAGATAPPSPRNRAPRRGEPQRRPDPMPVPLYGAPPAPLEGEVV
jgi:hypothetical protein